MMAKMFYTLDEAKVALGKNEEEIKQLAREGRLREFRDGPRLMFKADQVDQLKEEIGGAGDHVDLGPSDSGLAIGLADSAKLDSSKHGSGIGSGVGSGISSGSGLTLSDPESGRSPGAGMQLKDDTALAADLGLSGSVGGVPSPGRPQSAGSGTGLSGNAQSRPGVDVFQNDEVERVDASAQTAISQGANEQVSLEGVGSGSGLLDLTRESDDTSLGAELLDEIAPSGTGMGMQRTAAAESSPGGSDVGMSGLVDTRSVTGGINRSSGVIFQEKADPAAAAFGAAALGAAAVVIFGGFALITGVVETTPPIMQQLKDHTFAIVAGGGCVLTLVFFIIGMIIGKTTTR